MKNIGDFYRSATMKKISTVIACKRNRFDFWNSCKRLQNFVNMEALPLLRIAYADAHLIFPLISFQVQGTNDSSIVSKCSMAALGYFDDPFLPKFVNKVTRRAPLIHR